MSVPSRESSPDQNHVDPRLIVETCTELTPEVLEEGREIFRLELAGKSQQEIAMILSVSRSTVARRLSDYRRAYRRQLESQPRIHLISERLAGYESITQAALKDAENSERDRDRKTHRETALKAMRCFDELATSCGVFPKAADQAFIFTQNLGSVSELPDHEKSPEELRADILQLLRFGRRLP